MTTIRDELIAVIGRNLSAFDPADIAEAFDIDPDLPAEWATVDRCLTWLHERGYWLGDIPTDVIAFTVHRDDASDWAVVVSGPTLHAALIAACRAVQEAQP